MIWPMLTFAAGKPRYINASPPLLVVTTGSSISPGSSGACLADLGDHSTAIVAVFTQLT